MIARRWGPGLLSLVAACSTPSVECDVKPFLDAPLVIEVPPPVVTAGDTVRTAAELMAALDRSRSGDIVWVAEDSVLVLDDVAPLDVGEGVTVASAGGRLVIERRSVLGALRLTGRLARVSGLEFIGPDSTIGDVHASPISTGILVEGANGAIVDRSTLSGWTFAGVRVVDSRGVRVVLNFLHENQRMGLGYGVALYGSSSALVARNVFDRNRHAIAGSGDSAQSYRALENVVTRAGPSHTFDMHGAHEADPAAPAIAGESVEIRDNWILDGSHPAVVIRGRPTERARIFRNEFVHGSRVTAIRQHYLLGSVQEMCNRFDADTGLAESALDRLRSAGAPIPTKLTATDAEVRF